MNHPEPSGGRREEHVGRGEAVLRQSLAEARSTDLLARFDDDAATSILGVGRQEIARRRDGDGWTVSEVVKIAAHCRLRPSQIFA